ncbi:hypothetical protein LIER_43681 [Lithospermum erythrorhizon]|uniref:Pentatricopeptide repeat-containing protein n=1 Tax=Lithospermum erythrorhizon TaxID=34254 RepID=A0AAV3QJV0_LITER
MSSSLALRHLRHLSTTTPTPSSLSIAQAKSRLKSEYNPDKALQIYSSISKDNTSPLSTRYAQEYTVKRLAKAYRFDQIKAFLESHKKDPKIKNEGFLASIIRSYGVAGLFDEALKIYTEMDDLGTPRSSISFNALLSAHVRGKRFEDALKVFDEMPQRHGFKPDKVSYGILVKAYCGMGKVDLAMERLREMEENGVEITSVTYTTVLHSFFQKGMVDEAEKVWNDMVSKGCADVGAYNVRIMNAHGGNVEDVKELIEEMSNNGLVPDAITYNYLMTSYCKRNSMDEAIKVFDDLESNGCQPNAATFRTLVFHLCKNGRFETAHDFFKKSVVAHKIPDFNTLKYLVEGLVKNSKTEEAKEMILCIKKKFPPNVVKAWGKLEKELGFGIAHNDESASVGSEKVASA